MLEVKGLDEPVYSHSVKKSEAAPSGSPVKGKIIEPNKNLTIRSDEEIASSRASLENVGLTVPWRVEPVKQESHQVTPPVQKEQKIEPPKKLNENEKLIEPQKKKTVDKPTYSEDLKIEQESENKQYLDLVILEDNFYVRFVLRHLVAYLMKHAQKDVRIYSSEEGIQGLGYVMVTIPKLVIIDATLPKYSGKEVVEFLLSNTRLMSLGVDVLVLKDCEDINIATEDGNVKVLNKCDKSFIPQFIEYLDSVLLEGRSLQIAPGYDSVVKSSARLVSAASDLDASAEKVVAIAPFFKVLRSIKWLFRYFSVNKNMIWLYLLAPRAIDDNVKQEMRDLSRYRIRSYSALLVTMLAVGFLIAQLVLLWIGKGFFN